VASFALREWSGVVRSRPLAAGRSVTGEAYDVVSVLLAARASRRTLSSHVVGT